MTESNKDQQFARLVQKFEPQSKLLRAWELKGGVSAQVTALEVEQSDGQTKKMIVRQHGAADLKANPHIAADEFKLLQILQAQGLAVPTPYYVDESNEIFPTPYLVAEFIEGLPDFAPFELDHLLRQLATYLARIHKVEAANVPFLPLQDAIYSDKFKQYPAKMDDSIDEPRIRETLAAACPLTQHNPSMLLHGDFWVGNTLWSEGQLVSVIDWEDAKVGDPLADLAISRLEMLWAFGIEPMSRFTQAYYEAMPQLDFTNLPYWDLCAALRPAFKISEWATDAAAEQNMHNGHRLFISQAFAKLSAG